jgi:hypothetical protein
MVRPHFTCRLCGRERAYGKFSVLGRRQLICADCEATLPEPLKKPQAPAEAVVIGDDDEDDEPELDENIISLVQALSRYPLLITLGSCGGHEVKDNPSQWDAGTWYVTFRLPATKGGWLVLEHLAWAINHDYRSGNPDVSLLPKSPPPFLNTPGEMLRFAIEGYNGADPDDLAQFLKRVRGYLTM